MGKRPAKKRASARKIVYLNHDQVINAVEHYMSRRRLPDYAFGGMVIMGKVTDDEHGKHYLYGIARVSEEKYPDSGGFHVFCGCRFFSLPQAISHWARRMDCLDPDEIDGHLNVRRAFDLIMAMPRMLAMARKLRWATEKF